MATATERAYQSLRGAIVRGELVPGEHLREVALAERYQLSRTPVREALRQLAVDGLVEVSPQRGARVVSWDDSELHEIFALRALLEGHGAAGAARNHTDDQLARMRDLVGQMELIPPTHDNADVALRTDLNNQFHATIIESSGGTRLGPALSSLLHVPLVLQTYLSYSEAAILRSQSQHADLVEAIALRNEGWACSLMEAHIWAGHAAYMTSHRA